MIKCSSFLLLLALMVVSPISQAAVKDSTYKEFQYLILFKDKKFNYSDVHNHATYLSERALQRRKAMGIEIDSLDYPVSPAYIENLQKEGLRVRYVTKWLNGAVIGVEDHESANILKLKFYVQQVVYLGSIERLKYAPKKTTSFEELQSAMTNDESAFAFKTPVNAGYGESFEQNNMVGAITMHQKGLTGKGVQIAVFDAGFFKADKLSTFDKMFKDGRVKFTLDLVDDEKDVFDDDDHGLHVLSCMAAYSPNRMIGTAYEADYYLFRTEIGATEFLIEELNWIRAAEMADSMGVDIINSSLGYTSFDDTKMNHRHEELDGKTAYISRGASIAASKGMLVVNSAGNDGNDPWKKIGFPADVASIISVGAVDNERKLAPFSSIGPTADKRIKPDVCAMGYFATVASSYGTFYPGNGTSYSAPILCGAIACMYQEGKTISPQTALDAIHKSGSRFNSPDTLYGYGVPDVYAAMTLAGANPFFDYQNPGLIYPWSDTTNGSIVAHVYGKGYKSVSLNVYKEKKFLFLFKHKKSTLYLEETVRPDGFVTFRHDLKKHLHKDKYYVKIELKEGANSKRTILVQKDFLNIPVSR